MNAPELARRKALAQEFFFSLVNQISKRGNVNRTQLRGKLVEIGSCGEMALGKIDDHQQSQKADNCKDQRDCHRRTILCNSWSQNSSSDFPKPLPTN